MFLRKYETVIAIRTDITEDVIDKFHQKLTNIIRENNGHEIKFEVWGKRKLAYEIKQTTKGILIYYLYLGKPGIVEELERKLRLDELVLRFFTQKLADEVDPDTYDFTRDRETSSKSLSTDEE